MVHQLEGILTTPTFKAGLTVRENLSKFAYRTRDI